MRVLLLVVWVLIPVGALAFHLGPGQEHLKLDTASQLLRDADQWVQDENWVEAQAVYEEALANVPEDREVLRWQVQLKLAKVQMKNSQLPEANEDLKSLVDVLAQREDVDRSLLNEAREALANSQYYVTWLRRLEGHPHNVWSPDIESAQQTFRWLAGQAKDSGDEASYVKWTGDLESSVRLARMDLGELQGLPLPSQ